MRFGLLGPLLVERDGTALAITSPKARALLAALLLQPNRPVPVDSLRAALWGDCPPPSATASLQNHVTRLRRQLGDDKGERLRGVPSGYLLRVDPGELDATAFADGVETAREARLRLDWETVSDSCARALALWRGDPLDDLRSFGSLPPGLEPLVAQRLQLQEWRFDAELQLGRYQGLEAGLRACVEAHPLREEFHRQLMLVLHRSNRRADALDVYQRLRRTLVRELGVEPAPSVQQVQQELLAEPPQPAPAAPGAGAGVPAPAAATVLSGPDQLPADTRLFTGRCAELERLVALAERAPQGTDAAMAVISAIDGMGGVGKSALAIRAAHRVRHVFPDGRLFIDLQGHTPGLDPITPGDALDCLLRSLGVPNQRIPRDLGERAAFYRARLAGTRTLLVLDNAAGTAQVRPLLPGAPGCLVLVTSRKRLPGLDDADIFTLDTLDRDEAVVLLHTVAGRGRIPADHPLTDELITLCGGLPLALRIVGARLRHRRGLRVEDLVEQLRDERRRLDGLSDEDRDLAAVFASSYQGLPEPEQQLFRRLGLVPGPDVDIRAAARLLDTGDRAAEHLLESLLDHNLLIQQVPERYRFHDLVRLHARDLMSGAARQDPAEAGQGAAALERLLDHYQHTAGAADRHLVRRGTPAAPGAAAGAGAVPLFADRGPALAWMRAERDNLLAAVAHAADLGQSARVLSLTSALAVFLGQEGPWPQAAQLHRDAVATAQRLGDRPAEAGALTALGRVLLMIGDCPGAVDADERALVLHRELGARAGEADALWELSRARHMARDYADSVRLSEQALAAYQELGDRLGEANARLTLGRSWRMQGDLGAAVGMHELALSVYQELGDRLGEANALWDLGRVRETTGDYPGAVERLERALEIYQGLGSRVGEANARCALGRLHHLSGRDTEAAELLEQALAVYRSLGEPHGEVLALYDLGRVRRSLGDTDGAAAALDKVLSAYQQAGDPKGQAGALRELALVRRDSGDRPAAARLLEQAAGLYEQAGLPALAAEARAGLSG